MPIVGMTRRQDVEEAAHRLVYGMLRKGGPKTDPKKPGPELEYWRFTSERADLVQAFYAAYPAQPKEIDAYLPFPDLERNWQTWYEEYDAGGLRHRCDGRTMSRWRKADGTYQDGEQPCPYFAGRERTRENPGCKQVGRLYLVLPDLIKAGYVGLVTMETHSINDLISITASLLDIERKTGGRLSGVLLSVIRVKETISTPAWKDEDKAAGRRNRTVKNLVKVVPQADWVMARVQIEAAEQMALAQGKPLELDHKPTDHDDWNDDDGDDDNGNALPEFAEPPLPDAAPEYTEGEFTPVAPESDPPTPAAQIIARLKADAARHDEAERNPSEIKLAFDRMRGNVSELVHDDAERKQVAKLIFGKDSSKHLTAGECLALAEWIHVSKVNDNGATTWVPSSRSVEEWRVIRGQTNLV